MIKIIKKEDLETKEWSGGTTTQLYIYPEDALYEKRDFLFRISTATVDIEESIFTKLPGISRCIMPLEGEMELNHKGHYAVTLKKFETDSFEGDWETTSKGKVKDFNLMTSKGIWGYIGSTILKENDVFSTKDMKDFTTLAIYIQKGNIKIESQKEHIYVSEGDFVIYHRNRSKNINPTKIIGKNNAEIAIAILRK